MTDSIFGFFGPEERAAASRSERDPDLALRVLRFAVREGAATMSVLHAELGAGLRSLVAAVDSLEVSGLVTIEATDREETVRPTEAGARAVTG